MGEALLYLVYCKLSVWLTFFLPLSSVPILAWEGQLLPLFPCLHNVEEILDYGVDTYGTLLKLCCMCTTCFSTGYF